MSLEHFCSTGRPQTERRKIDYFFLDWKNSAEEIVGRHHCRHAVVLKENLYADIFKRFVSNLRDAFYEENFGVFIGR